MFKKTLIACAALVGLALSPAPSFAAGKVLTVGTDTSFMPFEFEKGGIYVGFDIDLWTAAAKIMGVKFTLQPMDFNGLIPALQTHTLDAALAGMTIKPERQKVVDFSDPYYESGLSLLVRADNKTITSLADLAGKHVATKQATSSVDYLRTHVKGVDVSSFPNIDNAFLELQTGRADAVLFDTPVVSYYATTAGKGTTRVLNPPVSSGEFYGFAFPKGSPIVAKFNKALKTMKANGQYAALYKKWFGKAP
ncbi:glutamine-binding periplasmic protein precursor [mine drainage metagenome]|uniref:Glutamine-binding periplasmic protein n=1 Tax=mine drainage metagenome TaxID=410659 RepID=A0A1J5R9L4_9ZZZZ